MVLRLHQLIQKAIAAWEERLRACLALWYTHTFILRSHSVQQKASSTDGIEELKCLQAVLLIGFSQYEVDAFRAFMIDMDADMVKVCSAFYTKEPFLSAAPV